MNLADLAQLDADTRIMLTYQDMHEVLTLCAYEFPILAKLKDEVYVPIGLGSNNSVEDNLTLSMVEMIVYHHNTPILFLQRDSSPIMNPQPSYEAFALNPRMLRRAIWNTLHRRHS